MLHVKKNNKRSKSMISDFLFIHSYIIPTVFPFYPHVLYHNLYALVVFFAHLCVIIIWVKMNFPQHRLYDAMLFTSEFRASTYQVFISHKILILLFPFISFFSSSFIVLLLAFSPVFSGNVIWLRCAFLFFFFFSDVPFSRCSFLLLLLAYFLTFFCFQCLIAFSLFIFFNGVSFRTKWKLQIYYLRVKNRIFREQKRNYIYLKAYTLLGFLHLFSFVIQFMWNFQWIERKKRTCC